MSGDDSHRILDRRKLLGGMALAGSAMASTPLLAATITPLKDLKKEADIACLYHCDFGDPARYLQMLQNISNHYSVYGANPFDVQIAIVTHAVGVKYFLDNLDNTPWKDDAPVANTFERVSSLSKSGLKVYLCDITFERQKIERAKARIADFISFVPSGVAAVAALQSRGYGYIKIG